MRFTLILKGSGHLDDGGRFDAELVRAGVLLASERLTPPAPGETPIAAFWVIQVRSREEALAWAKRSSVDLEVREVTEGG